MNTRNAVARLMSSGLRVITTIRPDGAESVQSLPDFRRRDPMERAYIMEPRNVDLTTEQGAALLAGLSPKDARAFLKENAITKTRNGYRMKVEQVCYYPASVDSKAQPVNEVGLTSCERSGRLFYQWTHTTKQGGVWTPKVYTLCPVEQVTDWQNAMDAAAKKDALPDGHPSRKAA